MRMRHVALKTQEALVSVSLHSSNADFHCPPVLRHENRQVLFFLGQHSF